MLAVPAGDASARLALHDRVDSFDRPTTAARQLMELTVVLLVTFTGLALIGLGVAAGVQLAPILGALVLFPVTGLFVRAALEDEERRMIEAYLASGQDPRSP